MVALRVTDPLDRKLPSIGWIPVQDPESGQTKWVYTGRKITRTTHAKREKIREAELKALFARSGVDQAVLCTDRPYVQPLMQLFDRRG